MFVGFVAAVGCGDMGRAAAANAVIEILVQVTHLLLELLVQKLLLALEGFRLLRLVHPLLFRRRRLGIGRGGKIGILL